MTVTEIETVVGKPTHPERDLKNQERWITDSAMFSSRLIVSYHDTEQPLTATNVKVTRYCKLVDSYPVRLEKNGEMQNQ
jgi:hypothetical protein